MTVAKKDLYKPIQFGRFQLKNRIALAPLTRFRADDDHTPNELMAQYYEERAKTEGSLLITEGTFISEFSGLYERVPGVWNEPQVAAWKKITSRVHDHDSKIFCQLWALGRTGGAELLRSRGYDYTGPSESRLPGPNVMTGEHETPRALTKAEIKKYVQQYAIAAKNAIRAGMDGVEIHSAHGYLPNQFLFPDNSRNDEYGSQTLENRARFVLEVVDAVIEAVGADRVGIRFSPWLNNDIGGYEGDGSPLPLYSYLIHELQKRADAGNQLAYLHIVEPRVQIFADVAPVDQSNEWIRLIWKGPLIRAGGYNKELAEDHVANDDNLLIAFGRYYISNPDLTVKLERDAPLIKYHRPTFYSRGIEGYTTYKRDEQLSVTPKACML